MDTTPLEPYFQYWGKIAKKDQDTSKRIHLLPYHCLDVAAVGHALLEANPRLLERLSSSLGMEEDDTRALLVFFFALHDMGKFSESFQQLDEEVLGLLQKKKSRRVYAHRHDSLGFKFWNDRLGAAVAALECFPVTDKARRRLAEYLDPLARSVFAHHGLPVSVEDIDLAEEFSEADVDAASRFIQDVADLFAGRPIRLPDDLRGFYKNLRDQSWLLAGFVVTCDWIGSNSAFFSLRDKARPLVEYWPVACHQATEAVRAAGILPETVEPFRGMGALFPALKDEEPSPLQRLVMDCPMPGGPQLWIIEDITGSGKTEAAVILAHRLMQQGADGFFVGLPTMATANAMYERLASVYRNLFSPDSCPSIVLSHGKRHLMEGFFSSIMEMDSQHKEEYAEGDAEASAACSQWIADNRKKAFLAHAGIGTIDQALLAVLPSKYHTLRLFGLATKVLIVDEVHACDAYMAELLKALLQFQASLGGSAILLSATIPHQMRQDFTKAFLRGCKSDADPTHGEAFPMVTSVSAEKIDAYAVEARSDLHRSIAVTLVSDPELILQEIQDASESGATVCWVRNTVADAIEAYEALQRDTSIPDEKLMLFHARFAMGHRLNREADVLARFGKKTKADCRKGSVLVATQVVEQSLDLDFDFMVSDLAPIDLIIQRAGRVHRHRRSFRGNRPDPVLWVFSPDVTDSPGPDWYSGFLFGASCVYPDHGMLWRTARLLDAYRGWTMPGDARHLIEGVYNDECAEPIPEGLMGKHGKAEGENYASRSQGRTNVLDMGKGYGGDPGPLFNDTRAPTRLGEPSITFRLAQRSGSVVSPLCDAIHHRWALSEIQVRESQIAFSAENDEDKALAASTMADKGKWSEIIILEPQDQGTWTGSALNKGGDLVKVTYRMATGLHIHKGRE